MKKAFIVLIIFILVGSYIAASFLYAPSQSNFELQTSTKTVEMQTGDTLYATAELHNKTFLCYKIQYGSQIIYYQIYKKGENPEEAIYPAIGSNGVFFLFGKKKRNIEYNFTESGEYFLKVTSYFSIGDRRYSYSDIVEVKVSEETASIT